MPHHVKVYGLGLRYMLCTILWCLSLFAGVTVWLDAIEDWYVMPLFVAVSLTLNVLIQRYMHWQKFSCYVILGHWRPYGTQTRRSCD